MKEEKSVKKTIILNKSDGDGFLDLSSSQELSTVMKILNRTSGDSHEE